MEKKYIKSLSEHELMDLSEEEIEQMFGSYNYDKLISLIMERGYQVSTEIDFDSSFCIETINHGQYTIAVFETVMGFEEWHLFANV